MSLIRSSNHTGRFRQVVPSERPSSKQDNFTFGDHIKHTDSLNEKESFPSPRKNYVTSSQFGLINGDFKKKNHPYYASNFAPKGSSLLQGNQSKYEEQKRQSYHYKIEKNKQEQEYICFCFPKTKQ